jgi:hypothetical protein
MTAAHFYRIRAAQLTAGARRETSPKIRAEYMSLAQSYLRLAETADRNSETDIVYEPPPDRRDKGGNTPDEV